MVMLDISRNRGSAEDNTVNSLVCVCSADLETKAIEEDLLL